MVRSRRIQWRCARAVDDRLTGQIWVTVVATGFGMTGARHRVFGERPLRDDTLEPPSFLQN